MEQAIELYSKIQDPLAAIERMGKFIGESGMFGCQKVQQGMVIAAVCLARRIDPLEFIETYHLIGGKPSMRADKMLARFQERGGKLKIVSRTADRAAVLLTKDGEVSEFSLTWEDAQQEPFVWKEVPGGKKVLKDNYATPRARMQMLWARVVSDGIRTVDPGVNSGLYTPEENGDEETASGPGQIFPEKNVTPTDIAPAPEPVRAAATEGLLDVKTAYALLQVIPAEMVNDAVNFLRSVGWLADGEMVSHLTPRRAQSILDKPQAFLNAVQKWAEAQAQPASEPEPPCGPEPEPIPMAEGAL